ncbi:AmmeMemoRadiSam system radical SAM enzyme [Pseudaeromonas sharmana]|uniref:AmmeMemoRadiSam system radical SAM enzyme n=1 Tax=Pseudaeromonas sharmana TaxID=328412 RepID=A0ABV8CLX0_9GAMM
MTTAAICESRYARQLADGRVECTLCPRYCHLRDGKRGVCYVRQALGGRMVLAAYGRTSGLCIDPIEKKPLFHFYPGSSVLSFGTAGCNLTCKFCQNWQISKSRQAHTLSVAVTPDELAQLALRYGCRSVAFTYNDPVIYLEYASAVAQACHARAIATVAVTAGYINPEPATELFADMDAANVDLKGFTDAFYHQLCGGQLAPVLETLRYLYHETDTWLEITTLLIPGLNDDEQQLRAMCEWIGSELGSEVPLHFTAFHPDYHLLDRPATPLATLVNARQLARQCGLQHVYIGNRSDLEGEGTCCAACGHRLISRDGYRLTGWQLQAGACPVCHQPLAGRFAAEPGDWGARRLLIRR